MPIRKVFTKFLAGQTKGIDGQTAAIEDDTNFVNRAVNYEMAVGNSARGRVGCQTSGSYGFFAIFPYRYTRTVDQYDITYQVASGTYPTQTPGLTTTKTVADGASIEKLIALNEQVWVLDTMNIVATYVSGSYPFTWYTTVGSNTINFIIKSAGSAILTQSISNGLTTLTNGANRTIYELVNIIDALAQFSIATTRGVRPPFALVNGNQTSTTGGSVTYGLTETLTVNAGHTFQAGDVISAVISSQLLAGIIISTSGTTITYVGPIFTVLDNQILGYMAQATSSFPITSAATAVSGNLTFSFPYWRLIPAGDKNFFVIFNSAHSQWGGKANLASGISGNFYAPAVAENAIGNLYIAASGIVSDGSDGYANNLIKIDGTQATKAGLPALTAGGIPITPGALGALTGSYKYKFLFRYYDAQGNITEGPESATYTYTFAANYASVAISALQTYTTATGFLTRSCLKHNTESPAAGASFYVDDAQGGVGNQAFIQPGDIICLTDNTAAKVGLTTTFGGTVLGTLHRTRCTAYTAQATTISPTISSIKVEDSSGYQINADIPISTGLTVVTLRTTAGGNQFYELCEIPATGYPAVGIVFQDNVTDAVLTLGVQYLPPVIGKEHNPPPSCTLVCQHQGGLVVARGPTTPNTVGFSTAEGIEYFPTASNSFDVPSTRAGFITAIASDTDDRLAVFKERAYYDILGDLDGGSFSVNVKNEGDYGITSQASLIRVPFGLCGLSKNGWVVISDGLLDPFRFMEINARIINQKYQFAWATAVNDSYNRNYLCTIPQISGEPVGYVIDYSRPNIRAFERSYATQIDQAGGGAMIGDTLYHLSATSPYGVFRRLQRFDGDSPSGNGDGDSFIDNVGAITYILESTPYGNDTPETLRSYNKLRVWSIPNDYVVEGWVPFSMLVETGASSFANYIGLPNPQATSSTITFSDNSVEFKDVDLVRNKTHFYMVRFTTNTIRTAPFLTGYALILSENYNPEDLIRG